jgi:hypothetical protein
MAEPRFPEVCVSIPTVAADRAAPVTVAHTIT